MTHFVFESLVQVVTLNIDELLLWVPTRISQYKYMVIRGESSPSRSASSFTPAN